MPLPLVERSKEEIERRVRRKVEALAGVGGISRVSVRISGKRVEIDLLARMKDDYESKDPHKIALNIEREIVNDFPGARVVVHTEPVGNTYEKVWRLVKDIAEGTPGSRGVHNIHIQRIEGKLCIDLHLEVSANMTVKQAHEVADEVEGKIKESDLNISDVTVHIESASDRISRELAGAEIELESFIEDLAKNFHEIKDVHGIKIRRFGDATHLVLHCQFSPELTIEKAHEIAGRLEKEIRTVYPEIVRIDIHEEPA